MATKSTRSSGTQHNARGATQGNTLVGPRSGLPIDEIVDGAGVRRLAVDTSINVSGVTITTDDLNATDDAVRLEDPNTGAHLKINANGSIDVNVQVSAASGDNIAISDGTNSLFINPDGSINVNISPVTTPTIVNIVATLANTEYSYNLPTNTKKFSLMTRGIAKTKMAFISGQTSTNYITISPGARHEESGLNLTATTVYFQLSKAGETVEILSWL